jgi:DNA-binding transcriptional LysR family regulator
LNFDIDCLRSFVVVADTMSVSRAADNVGRSQSTVSQQIAKLETQVGKPLLVRRKGRVIELTPEGGKLLQFARRMLQLNDEAYASMSDDALTGFVRLGVPYSSGVILPRGYRSSRTGILWSGWKSRQTNRKTS